MTKSVFAALLALPLLVPMSAQAIETSVQLQLGATSDFERHVMVYDCAAETPITVTYINAAPNFLAIVPVPEETEQLIFASVVSASGARYASGHWIWWTSGTDASLYDATLGDDADPILTCSELNNTP